MSFRRFVGVGVLAALAVVGAGCKRSESQGNKGAASSSAGRGGSGVPAKGELIAPGAAVDLRVSPDGQFVTYLLDAKKPPIDGIPPKLVLGKLHVAPVVGGAPRAVGSGVTNDVGG